MIEGDRFLHALKARRASLSKEVLAIEDALDDPPSKDWEDRAAERQGDEVLEAKGVQDLSELHRIDAALKRYYEGTYGACTVCGDKITEDRLLAIPETPFCKKCARQH